ncbi:MULTISPECIES: adenylate/guanylate cyclase domain-containing protein [unclassified Ruegeria]|uniref:adenylate/guanylate cyclase domain-containing protein n=1 Tax=unclassified Ruegeria TaxID=2625375 RepID=UPI001488566F|nr:MULTISPECIES: adenylate/guanylate cyclase domain-containing protein [unclassified Ruegeria]
MARRLAAILMADVVEYSRLMREDETRTLAALQQFWAEIFDPIVAERRGRIVKKMGDGALLEFSSVVDAVEAALKIQRRNIEVNGKIRLRIGVNLGDIIIDDDDIFGDGVNVAARLEALAEPDGICISSLVHESVGNRVEASFVDAGEHDIKGLERPIRVFRWPEKGAVQAKQDKPSIAILPFENLSSDPDDEYFSQGVADDIATDLSKISGLFVVARNATREYKNRSQSVGEAAVELGVRYILQGTVRRGSGRVRVNASLIDTDNSIQLWADRFDGDLAEVFEFQDRIAESIVATLAVTLTQAEQDRAFRKVVKSLKAYDYVLQGNAFHARSTKIDNAKAMEHYSRAIELDPEYAPAHAGLAWALVHDANQRWGSDPEASLDLALKHAKRAVQLDVSLGKAHMVLGDVYCWTKRHSLAVAEGRKAVELEPSNADAHFALGYYLIAAGASEEAVKEAQLALRYNPVFAMGFYYEVLGTALYLTKSYDAAIAALEEGLGKYPDHDGLHQLLSATYAKLDDLDAARVHSQEYLRLRPEDSLTKISERLPYKNKSDLEHLIDGLRLAGLPE